MDIKTEAWVIVASIETPMSLSTTQITQLVYGIRTEPRMGEYKNVLNALNALKREGLIECRSVKGSPQKLEWYSTEKIRAIIG